MVNGWKITAIIFILISMVLTAGIYSNVINIDTRNKQCEKYGEENIKVCAIRCFQQEKDSSKLIGDYGEVPECICN